MDDSARLAALQLKVADLERKLNFVLDQLKLNYQELALNPALSAATDLLRGGNKLEAIKVYQKMTGAGLKESKDAVEALEKSLGAA
jgi:ribosomal L7/L12-like protein